jgi:hypothetical protein
MPVGCKTCESPNQEECEAVGLLAESGDISWAEAARRLDLTHPKGLQNHMANHYVAPPTEMEGAMSDFDTLLAGSIEELMDQMRIAPPEVKPFYAVAIQNLRGIGETKPSQQHLINALKGIHEVTGMRMEQRLLLDFASHHFNAMGAATKAAVEAHTGEGVIDLDPLECSQDLQSLRPREAD